MTLVDGKIIDRQPVARATGHPSRPLTEQQLHDKFAACVEVSGFLIPAEILFRRLSAIQSITARELTTRM